MSQKDRLLGKTQQYYLVKYLVEAWKHFTGEAGRLVFSSGGTKRKPLKKSIHDNMLLFDGKCKLVSFSDCFSGEIFQ